MFFIFFGQHWFWWLIISVNNFKPITCGFLPFTLTLLIATQTWKFLTFLKLFVADAPMKKKSNKLVSSLSEQKYGSENRPKGRGLIEMPLLFVTLTLCMITNKVRISKPNFTCRLLTPSPWLSKKIIWFRPIGTEFYTKLGFT